MSWRPWCEDYIDDGVEYLKPSYEHLLYVLEVLNEKRLGRWSVMDYHDLCSRIFSADRRIRYATVTDQRCKIMAGGMRPGLRSIEATTEETKKIDVQVAILDGIIRTWGESLGRARFALIQHEKANMLIVPFEDKHVELSIETSMPLNRIESIVTLIETAVRKS